MAGISISRVTACRLAVLVLSIGCAGFFVPAVHAQDLPNPFFTGWNWQGTGSNVYLPSLGDLIPLPGDYHPDHRGAYAGPCPIGEQGAPELINTNLQSGGLCRGACGSDCPADRCHSVPDVHLELPDGTCTYHSVLECEAAQGCVDHDRCYDYCSESLANSRLSFLTSQKYHDLCQDRCDLNCYLDYDAGTCAKWADFPGKMTARGGSIMDFLFPPRYDFSLFFSDPPNFTPRVITPTTTPPPPTPTHPTTIPTTVQPAVPFDVKISSLTCAWTVKTGDYGVKSDCVRIVSRGTAKGPVGARLELPILAWSDDKFSCGSWTLKSGALIAVGSTCVRVAGQPESTTWTVDTGGDDCPTKEYFPTSITHTVKIYNDDEITPQAQDSNTAGCR